MNVNEEIKNLKEAWDELAENIHTTIDTQEDIGKISKEKADKLRKKASMNQHRELSKAVDRAVEKDPEYEGRSAIYGNAWPYGIKDKHLDQILDNRHLTKNAKGENKTTERHFKGMDVTRPYGVIDPSSSDWKIRKAIGKAKVKANKRSIKEEVEELTEAFDELFEKYTVAQWKQAAKNSIEARKKASQDAENKEDFMQSHSSIQGPLDSSKPWLYTRKQVLDAKDKTMKAWDREERAKKLANELPDSKADAGKLFNAAKKAVKGRTEATDKAQADVETERNKKSRDHEKFYKKLHNRNKAVGREDQARMLSGAPLRDFNHDKKLEASNGNYLRDKSKLHVPGKGANESLQEQIISLKEAFDELFESSHVRKYGKPLGKEDTVFLGGTKFLKDNSQMSPENISGQENGGRYVKVDYDKMDQKEKLQHQIKNAKKISGKNSEYAKVVGKEARELSNRDSKNESLQSQIISLKEAFDELFEAGIETEKSNTEKEVSPNKISKKSKTKDGETVEKVSVADELFPYEGNAKQQYNQKIIAKINDMIEGTATLEDLIHLVRQKKVAPVKEK